MKKFIVFLILFAGISAFQTVNAEIIDSVTFKGKHGKDVTLYNVCMPNGKCVRDESEYYPWRSVIGDCIYTYENDELKLFENNDKTNLNVEAMRQSCYSALNVLIHFSAQDTLYRVKNGLPSGTFCYDKALNEKMIIQKLYEYKKNRPETSRWTTGYILHQALLDLVDKCPKDPLPPEIENIRPFDKKGGAQ